MRPAHRRLAALTALFALSLLSCGREVTGPDNGFQYGRPRLAALALDPQMPSLFASLEGAGDVVAFENVRVVLRDEDGLIVFDSLVAFPVGADSIALTVTIPIPLDAPEEGLPLSLTMAYVNAAGDTVFRGGPAPVTAAPVGSSGSSQPITIPIVYDGVGKNATSVVITPATDTVVAGTSSAFTAIARDATNATIPLTPILFYTLDSARASVPNVGVGSVNWLPSRGIARIVAALPDGQPSDTAYVLVELPASQLVLGSGGGQSGTFGVALANPIVVRTLASDNVPVPGVEVVFAVATGGGSLTTLVDTSDANGDVSTSWTLGSTIGAQTITATAPGLTGSPLTITGTATAGAPARVEITAAPTTVVAGVAFAPTLTAAVLDNAGNLVTTYAGNVSVALDTGAAATLSGTTTVAAVGGVASFPGLSVDKVGSWDIYATSAALIADTAIVSITAAAAAALEFVQQPTSAIAGAVIAPSVTVRALDAFGNLVPTFAEQVSIGVASGPGGSILSGTVTLAAVSGVATYNNLSLNLAGDYTLASTSGALAVATSATFSVTAAGPATLQLVSGDAQSGAVGSTLADSLVVRVVDAFLNPVAGVQVEFATTSGSFSPDTVLTDVTGLARAAWTVGTLAGARTAKATSAGLADVNFNATVEAAAATQLLIDAPTNVSLTAGVAGSDLIIRAADAFGNLDASFAGTVSISIQSGPVGGAIVDGGGSVVAAGGFATFSGLMFERAGTYVLRVSSTGLSFVDHEAIIVGNAGAQAVNHLSGDGQTAPISLALADSIAVVVTDIFGNPIANHLVSFGVTAGGGSISPASVQTDEQGRAAAAWTLGSVLGEQTANADAGSVGSVDFTATATVGAPVALEFQTAPDGVMIAGQPAADAVIAVKDAQGNTVTNFSGYAHVLLQLQPVGATILAGGDSVPFVSGLATFSGLTLDIAGPYILQFNVGALPALLSDTITVGAGAADTIFAVSGDAQTGEPNSTLAAPVRVRVLDAFGNPVANLGVTYSVVSGDADPAITTVFTDSTGHSETEIVVHDSIGGLVIHATAAGVGGSPVVFTATIESGVPTVIQLTASPATSTAGETTSAFSVAFEDALSNPFTDYTDSVRFSVIAGPTGAPTSGTTVKAASAGVASFDDLVFTLRGSYQVRIVGDGVADTAFATIVVTAAAADTMVMFSGDAQTATVASTLPLPLEVRIFDAFGNAKPGVNVSWGVVSGDANVSAPTTVSDTNGFASVSVSTLNTPGAIQVQASVGGLPGSPITFSATSTAGAAAYLQVETQPVGAAAGDTLAAFTVSARDSVGNLVTSYAGLVNVAVDSGPLGALIVGNANVAAVGGIATFNAHYLILAGDHQLGFTAAGLAATTSSTFTITAGAAAVLALEDGNSQTDTVTRTLASPIRVRVTDQFGNRVSGHPVAWSVVSGDASVGSDTTLTDGAGLANVLVTLGDTAAAITLHATAAGLAGSPMLFNATAINEAFTALEVTAGPTSVVAGSNITYTVRARDVYGNTIADFADNVTISVADGPATFSFGTFTRAAIGGVTTFDDLQLDVIGNYTLNFTSGAEIQPALLTVTPSLAASLHFSVQPSLSTAGDLLSPISVIARDGFNNIVATFDSALIAIDSGTVGAVLSGTLQRAPTAGVATFSDLSINLSGTYRLSASWPGLSPITSDAFVVAPSVPDTIALLDGDAQSGTIQSTLPNPMRVAVLDSLGNGVPNVNVNWGIVSGFATLDSIVTATDSLGIAAMKLTFGDSVGVVTVTASAGGLGGSPITFTHGVLNAPAVRMVIESTPSIETAGVALTAIVVSARDSVLNYAIDFASSITAAIDSGPAGAVLSGGTSQPATAGVATFSDLSVDKIGVYRLRFSAGGLADTVSANFTVFPAAPATIALVDGDAQTDTVTRALDLALRVIVTDSLGNPIMGHAVAWSVASGDALVSDDTVLTGSDGISFVTLTLGNAPGAVTVEAASAGLTGSPVTFSATAVPDSFAVLVVTSAPDSVQSGSSLPWFVEARDAHGNVLPEFTASIGVSITGGPDSIFAAGTVNQSASAGVATFADLVFGVVGVYELTFDHSGVTVIDSVLVTTGASSLLFIVSGDGQTQMAGLTLDSALVVRIQDSQGNGIVDDTVIFSVTSGDGLVNGVTADTVLTDSTGHASAIWTLGAPLGAQTVSAVNPTLGTQNFSATATENVANTVWTGDANTQWANTANWKDGLVPGNADSVLVPAGRPNYPALVGNVGMARLTLADGASIDMQGWDILVFGSVSTPATLAMTNGGALYANGDSGTVVGAFTSLGIQGGAYVAAGTVWTNSTFRAFNNGSFDFGTYTHVIGADLVTQTNGTFAQSAGGVINVAGNVDLQGGSTAGMITGGAIYVQGSFSALGTAAFSADSAHVVGFNGSGQQTIFFSTPDTTLSMSCSSSCFGQVVSPKGVAEPGLQFLSDAKALGGFNVSVDTIGGENIVLVSGAPSTFDVQDIAVKRFASRGVVTRGGAFTPDTLVLWGDADVIVGAETIPTIVVGTASVGNSSPIDAPIWVDGTLDITGIAQLNSTLMLRGTGRLTMHEPNDTLIVGDDFSAYSDIGSDTTMTAGHLQLQSNLLQVGSGTGFRASVGHTTRFGGGSPTLTLQSGALNEFGTLAISESTGLAVSGNLVVTGDVHIEGTSGAGYINDLSGGVAAINGNLLDSLGGRWQYDTLHLTGNDPILPALLYADVTFTQSVALDTTLYVNSVTVSGSSASFDPNGRIVTVAGQFRTENGGVLVSDAVTDTLIVLGNASFHGGVSNLTQGYLEIHGNFDQGTEAESFAGSPTHSTWFKGSSPSSVTFANPGFGAGASAFGELYLSKDPGMPVVLSNDTYVNGKLETGVAVSYQVTSSGYKLVSRGAGVSDLLFSNTRWHLVEGALIDTLLRVSFDTMDPDSVQFYIERNDGPITLDSPSFATTPTGGRYLQVADADGGLSVVVNVVNATPAYHGGFVLESAGGLITGWLDFPGLNWTNAADQDWFNAANWAEGRVPTATDSVHVGAFESANMPIITGSTGFARQLVSTGINAVSVESELQIARALVLPTASTGVSCGTGLLRLTGADTVSMRGRATCRTEATNTVLVIDGTARLDSLTVNGTSRLAMRDDTLQVDEGLFVTGSGTFEMVDGVALLHVKGVAYFGGVTTVPALSAGTLRVSGAFLQDGTGTFAAGAAHITEFVDDVSFPNSTISFTDATTSSFGTLSIGGATELTSAARVVANTRLESSASLTGTSGRLAVGGDLSGSPGSTVDLLAIELGGVFADSGSYAADTTVFTGTGQVIPLVLDGATRAYEHVRITGTASMEGDAFQTYTLNGGLTIEGGLAPPPTSTVAVNGNLRTLGSGTLAMSGSSQINLEINGDAEFRGGSTTGMLTSGTLRVRGSLLQSNENSTSSFAASDSLTVVMDSAGIITLQDVVNSGFGVLRINAYTGGAGYLLESHIRAGKFESEGEGDSTRVTAGPAHGGNPAIITADTIIVQNELAAVNVALKLVGGTLSNLGGIAYAAFSSSTVPQLEIEAAGGSYNAGDVRFDGTATPPLYVRLNETVTGDLDTLQLTFGIVNPPVHGGNVQLSGDAFFTNWVANPEFRWTGALDGTWANAGNWATNLVPTASDSAYIPATVTNAPVISVNTDIFKLVSDLTSDSIRVEAQLGIGDLLILPRERRLYCTTGNVVFGAIVNAEVDGTVGCAVVAQAGTLSPRDSAAVGSLSVEQDARVIVGAGDTLTVDGSFGTINTAQLQMNDATALMTVYGDATFAGGSVDGLLNWGRLRLNRSLTAVSAGAFISSNTHTTEFFYDGEGLTPSIDFQDPNNQRFNNVEFTDGNRNVLSRMVATGNVTVSASVTVSGGGGTSLEMINVGTLTVAGGAALIVENAHIPFALAVQGSYDVDTTHFTGAAPGTVPAYLTDGSNTISYDNVVVRGDWTFYRSDTSSAAYSIAGNLVVADSGIARFGGATNQTAVVIGGHLMTLDSARIEMANANTGVLVQQNAVFQGASTTGLLTAGLLSVRGDFGQGGHAEAFAANPGHTTSFEGTAAQTVTFADPGFGATSSHFGTLRLRPSGGGMSLALGNTVWATGAITADTVSSFPATISSAATQYITSFGGHVKGGLTFDNVHWTILNGEPLDTLESLTFTNIATDTTQLRIVREDGVVHLIAPTFSTAGIGTILRAEDFAGGGSPDLTIEVSNPVPLYHSFRADAVGGFATINGWPAEVQFHWTGAVSADWNVAGNWSMDSLPTQDDTVVVLSAATNQPTITSDTVTIGGLILQSDSNQLRLMGDSAWLIMTGGGSIDAPATNIGIYCDSTSSPKGVMLNSAAAVHTVRGRIACDVVANGNQTIVGDSLTVEGTLLVFNDFRLDTTSTVLVTGAMLDVQGGGRVEMVPGSSVLDVKNTARFAASGQTRLNGGRLRLGGNFRQFSFADNFQAAGSHITEFYLGNPMFDGTPSVAFDSPDSSGSFFHDVEANHSRKLGTKMVVRGSINLDGLVTLDSIGSLEVHGALAGVMSSTVAVPQVALGGLFNTTGSIAGVDQFIFFGANQEIPFTVGATSIQYDSITVRGTAYMRGVGDTITGNIVVQAGGELRFGQPDTVTNVVIVGGLATASQGTIRMNDSLTTVSVLGPADFSDGVTLGKLTDGVLDVSHHFGAADSAFMATDRHKVILRDNCLPSCGVGIFSVYAYGGVSGFQNLELVSGNRDAFHGFRAARLDVGAANLTSTADSVVVVTDSLLGTAGATMSLSHLRLGGALAFNGTYDVDTLILTGNGQRLPNRQPDADLVPYTHIRVIGSAQTQMASGDSLIVGTNLYVTDSGSLALGEAGFASLVRIGGYLITEDSGTVEMTAPSTNVHAMAGAYFGGGSTAGLLTTGDLHVYGTFSQDSTNSLESFAATGAHFTRLYEGEPRVVSFASPGFGAGSSHFGQLIVLPMMGGWVELQSDVYVESQLTVFGAYEVEFRSPELQFNRLYTNGADVTNADFRRTGWTLQGVIAADSINDLTFSEVPPDSVAWEITRESGTIAVDGVVFSSTPTTGKYLVITDSDGSSDLTVDIQNASPGYYGAFVDVLNTATLTGWLQTGPFLWTGAASDQVFTNPLNWAVGMVPTASDSVVIDSLALTGIEFSSPTTLGAFTMLGGSAFAQLYQPVTVTRSLLVGNSGVGCEAQGRFVLSSPTGTQFQANNLNCELQIVDGVATVDATTVVNDALTVAANGTLDLGGAKLTVTQNFSVTDTALLVMDSDADTLVIDGDAIFTGKSTVGFLTDGDLIVRGNFSAGGAVASSFNASANHHTRFTRTDNPTQPYDVNISNPGDSRFAFVTVDSTIRQPTSSMVIDSLLHVDTDGQLTGSGNVTAMGGIKMDSASTLDLYHFVLRGNFVADSGLFSPNVVDFVGLNGPGFQAIPRANWANQHTYERIRIYGDARMGQEGGGQYIITDSVQVFAGTLAIGASGEGSVAVNPTFLGQPTAALIVDGPTARLAMDGSSDIRFRDVRFLDGTTDSTSLVFGKLYVYRHFEAAPATFSAGSVDPEAGDVHEVIMMGDSSSITLGDPEPARFYDLTFNRGSDTELFSDVYINGRFRRGVADSSTAISIRSNVLNTVAPHTIHAFGGTAWGMIGAGYELTLQNVAVALYGSNDPAANGTFEFDDVRWEQMFPEATFLRINEAGNYIGLDSAVFEGLQFNSGVTTGKYFEVGVQSTGANPEVQFQNSSPSVGCMNTVCQATDFEPGVPDLNIWNGTNDTNWHDVANWSLGIVPDENTDVQIPNGPLTNEPQVTFSTAVARSIEVGSERVLTLNNNMTVNGDITVAGTIASSGGNLEQRPRNAITNFGLSVLGIVANYTAVAGPGGVQGQVQATSPVNVANSLNITAGRFNVNGQKVTTNDLNVTGSGRLQMMSAADTLIVSNGVLFDGQSTDGMLTAGVLDVAGNFTQSNTNSNEAFAASGTHVTVLRGLTPHTIALATPGPGSGTSHFGHIRAINGFNNKDVASELWATGAFEAAGGPIFNSTIGYTRMVSSGGSTDGVVFYGIRWEINPGEPLGSLQGIEFYSQDPSGTQLSIYRFGADTVAITDVVFDPVSFSGGFYFALIDAESDGNLVANFSNVSPVGHENNINILGGAVMNGWGEFLVHEFSGNGSDGSIQTLANWSNGVLPGVGDSVFVNNGSGIHTMVVDTDFAVRSIVMASDANISIQDTVSASGWMRMYTAGALNCSGNGALRLNSADAFGTSAGDCNAVIEGSGVTQMVDSTRVVDLTIRGNATFGLGNQILLVTGDFVTADSGRVRLFGNNDSLVVSGTATFGGGSTEGQLTDGHMVFDGDLTVSGGSNRALVTGPNLLVHLGNPSEVATTRTVQFDHDTVSYISNLFHHAGTTTIVDGSILPVRDSLLMVDAYVNTITGTNGATLRIGFDNNGAEYGFFAGSDQAAVTVSNFEMYGEFIAGDLIKPDTMDYLGTGTDNNGGVQRVSGVSAEETSMEYKVLRIRGNAEMVDENYPVNPGLKVSQRLEVMSDTLRIGAGSVAVHLRADTAAIVISGSAVLKVQDDSAQVVVDSIHFQSTSTSLLEYGEIRVKGAWVQRDEGANEASYYFPWLMRTVIDGNARLDIESPAISPLGSLAVVGGDTLTLASDVMLNGEFKRDNPSDGQVTIRSASLAAGNAQQLLALAGFNVGISDNLVLFRNTRVFIYADQTSSQALNVNRLTFTDMDPDVTALSIQAYNFSPTTLNSISFNYAVNTGRYFVNEAAGAVTVNFASSSPMVGCMVGGCAPGTFAPFDVESAFWDGSESGDYADPANWSIGRVPDAYTDVYIVAGMPSDPTLSTSQLQVRNLTLAASSSLTFNSFEVLYVRGSVYNEGSILGSSGLLQMPQGDSASLYSSGTWHPKLQVMGGFGGVQGVVALASNLSAADEVEIGSTGRLNLNGYTLTTPTFFTSGGRLTMTQPSSILDVSGNVGFSGGDNSGHLLDGIIYVGGNFTQSSPSIYGFPASGNHLVAFVGSGVSTVSFSRAGLNDSSHFANVAFDKTGGGSVLFSNTQAYVVENVTSWTSGIEVQFGHLRVSGTIAAPNSNIIELGEFGLMTLLNPLYADAACGPFGVAGLNVTGFPDNFLPAECAPASQLLISEQQGHQNQDEQAWHSLRQYLFKD